MLKKFLDYIISQGNTDRETAIRQNIMRDAAKMGGTVFGPVPAGHRREFFCLDEHTWVWHEEWDDNTGMHQVRTTRYDIRPRGILKAQDGQPYQPASIEEANRLCAAAQEYERRLHEKFDPLLATAGV